MKYCNKCGNCIDDNAIFCVNCGQRQGADMGGFYSPYTNPYYTKTVPNYTEEELKPSVPIAILSFLFNILGLVFWLSWRDKKPGKADSAAKGALCALSVGSPVIGVIFWAIFHSTYPKYAKVCLVGGIVGFFVNLVAVIVVFVLTYLGVITPEVVDAYNSYGLLFSTLTFLA